VNPGGNLEFDIGLVPAGSPASVLRSDLWTGRVPSTQHHGLTFRFSALDEGRLVNPRVGRFEVLVQTRQKQAIYDMLRSERADSWQLNSLRVTAVVELPAGVGTRKF